MNAGTYWFLHSINNNQVGSSVCNNSTLISSWSGNVAAVGHLEVINTIPKCWLVLSIYCRALLWAYMQIQLKHLIQESFNQQWYGKDTQNKCYQMGFWPSNCGPLCFTECIISACRWSRAHFHCVWHLIQNTTVICCFIYHIWHITVPLISWPIYRLLVMADISRFWPKMQHRNAKDMYEVI